MIVKFQCELLVFEPGGLYTALKCETAEQAKFLAKLWIMRMRAKGVERVTLPNGRTVSVAAIVPKDAEHAAGAHSENMYCAGFFRHGRLVHAVYFFVKEVADRFCSIWCKGAGNTVKWKRSA